MVLQLQTVMVKLYFLQYVYTLRLSLKSQRKDKYQDRRENCTYIYCSIGHVWYATTGIL